MEGTPTESAPIDEAVAVFIDTNCFIQARDLKDLPWRELIPTARRFEIHVTPTVIDELDGQKTDRRQRVRDRARMALDLIRQAGRTSAMRQILKEGGPCHIELVISNVGRVDWNLHPDLDASRPDDRLVAEVLTYTGSIPKLLLSHDTGPFIRGRRAGLDTRELPPKWLLSPVEDEAAKEISKLKRENEELKRRAPMLGAHWIANGGQAREIVIERLLLPPLVDKEILALIARSKEEIPLEQGVFMPSHGFLSGGQGGYTQEEYLAYYRNYEHFVAQLPALFEGLHERIGRASLSTAVDYALENSGNMTAEGLTIDFTVDDEWILFDSEQEAEISFGVIVAGPTPPLTPHMRKVDQAGSLARSILQSPAARPPRNPRGFHWESRPTGIAHSGELRCEEFRAKERWEDTIWVYPWNSEVSESRLHLSVHSRNASAPIETSVSLRVTDQEIGWQDPRVIDRTSGWLKKVLFGRMASPGESGLR